MRAQASERRKQVFAAIRQLMARSCRREIGVSAPLLLGPQSLPFYPVSPSRNPGRPGRSGATASRARCDSRRCPARPRRSSGTQPGAGTAIRTSQADTAASSAAPPWPRCTRSYSIISTIAPGRLDPSLEAIARKAGCCRRAAVHAIRRLKDLGLLIWQRRCEEDRDEAGRFRLRQRTNAYGLLPTSQWRGYRDTDPPPPSPDTLGAPERVPDPIEAAVAELAHGQRMTSLAALEADPGDRLALALAGLGRALGAI